MLPVPVIDRSRALAPIRAEVERAIVACIDRSSYLRGPETTAFEEEWAAFCGQSAAVCCNSGTDALSLAAMALGPTWPSASFAVGGIGSPNLQATLTVLPV